MLFAFSQRLSWVEGNPPANFTLERGPGSSPAQVQLGFCASAGGGLGRGGQDAGILGPW